MKSILEKTRELLTDEFYNNTRDRYQYNDEPITPSDLQRVSQYFKILTLYQFLNGYEDYLPKVLKERVKDNWLRCSVEDYLKNYEIEERITEEE